MFSFAKKLVFGVLGAVAQIGGAVAEATQQVAKNVARAARELVKELLSDAPAQVSSSPRDKLRDALDSVNDQLEFYKRRHYEGNLAREDEAEFAQLRRQRTEITRKLREVDALERGALKPDHEVEAERNLQKVNAEAINLKNRMLGRGLNERDKLRWRELSERRSYLNAEISVIDRAKNARSIALEEKSYGLLQINDATSHILQYHVGQSTYNKSCPSCGRPMVLQWQRGRGIVSPNKMFWGCSGWYQKSASSPHSCNNKLALSQSDLQLFVNSQRDELQLSPRELDQFIRDPTHATRLRGVLDHVRDQHRAQRIGAEKYRCPVHGERLMLRRKNKPSQDLLDQYFLGCPRWLLDQKGCGFIVKLKSPAQIAALLRSASGENPLKLAI
jgi:ssDNA-binding Zn-finger/Zn-ribbon topoisomerase 1